MAQPKRKKLQEAIEILRSLQFGPKQHNDVAAYALLALLDMKPEMSWSQAKDPLCGVTPIIEFVRRTYGVRYAPNTRETIRDEAVKHFVEAGMLLRNPDDPKRPTNSGKTVYQVHAAALSLIRSFGSASWPSKLKTYLISRDGIRRELERKRELAQLPVRLSPDKTIAISPGGQNPLIKAILESFCPRFASGGHVVYVGDAASKFLHLDKDRLGSLCASIPAPAKMPDVIVHDARRGWLLLVEAVASAGPVDGKRRKELKDLFQGCRAGLVFVTAFPTRAAMRGFLTQISWETEVWVAEDPDHMIHFDGERYLGPYPDVLPQ